MLWKNHIINTFREQNGQVDDQSLTTSFSMFYLGRQLMNSSTFVSWWDFIIFWQPTFKGVPALKVNSGNI